jgi:hypothetical protein
MTLDEKEDLIQQLMADIDAAAAVMVLPISLTRDPIPPSLLPKSFLNTYILS